MEFHCDYYNESAQPHSWLHRLLISAVDFLSWFSRKTIPAREVKKILILRHDRIGDLAYSTHLFYNLKKYYPQAQLDVLISSSCRELVELNPRIDHIIESDLWWFNYKENSSLGSRVWGGIKSLFDPEFGRICGILRKNRYDVVIDCVGKKRSVILAWLSMARYQICFKSLILSFLCTNRVELNNDLHVTAFWGHLLAPLGITSPELKLEICLPLDYLKRNEQFKLEKGLQDNDIILGIHPGFGGDPTRQWENQKWIELIKSLMRENYKIIFFYGPREEVLAEEIISRFRAENNFIIVKDSLESMMEKFKLLKVLICIDSGPMHLADVLGVPLVSLFARENPTRWRPVITHHFRLIRKLKGIGCPRYNCPARACINAIQSGEVLDEIKDLLSSICLDSETKPE